MKTCTSCGRINPATQTSCERCGAALPSTEPEPHSEQVIGSYDVLEFLGRGGMGSVYRARNARLGRDVAIKLLNVELSQSEEARARMEREARAMAALNHPNVVQIYDILDHDGLLALVLAYADDGALSGKLDEGALAWTDALNIMDGVLSGLTAIHKEGLVHRDLKPDNILFDSRSGQPMIADLGIAHTTDGPKMTRHGAQLGTPEYMSPEQVQGTQPEARSDLYACGIVLYELLSGEVPFGGESEFDIKMGQVQRDPDLSRLPPEVPQAVHAVIKRALEKAPADRYPDAATMQAALKASGTQSAQVASSAAPANPSPKPGDRVTMPGSSMAGERRVTTLDPSAQAPQQTRPPIASTGTEVHVPKSSGSGGLIAGAILGGCALIAGVVWMGQDGGSESSSTTRVERSTTTETPSKPTEKTETVTREKATTEEAKPARKRRTEKPKERAAEKPAPKKTISNGAKNAKRAYRSMIDAWNRLDANAYYEHIIEGEIDLYNHHEAIEVRSGPYHKKQTWFRGGQWVRKPGNKDGAPFTPEKITINSLDVLVDTQQWGKRHILLQERGTHERWYKEKDGGGKKPTKYTDRYILMRQDSDGVWRFAGEGDSGAHGAIKSFVDQIK